MSSTLLLLKIFFQEQRVEQNVGPGLVPLFSKGYQQTKKFTSSRQSQHVAVLSSDISYIYDSVDPDKATAQGRWSEFNYLSFSLLKRLYHDCSRQQIV